MTSDRRIAVLEVAAVAPQPFAKQCRAAAAGYWALTKPEINFLIAVATFAGFYLGCPSRVRAFPFPLLIHTLLGTVLVASGAGALNQYVERDFDAQMRRTARRPLVAGGIEPREALCFGVLLSAAGCTYLAVVVNGLASLLAVLTLTMYLALYTPLKRKTPFCTLVGAVPGAMPPLIGWAAASGTLGWQAWTLFAALFLWQFPHFMAIAWMYREDYRRAGYLVLPQGDNDGRFMSWQAIVAPLTLVLLGLSPRTSGAAGLGYAVAAFLLSVGFFYYSARL